MKDLILLQEEMQALLLSGNALKQTAIVDTENIPVETRLSIYQNAYYGRLYEALAANYPVLNTYFGEEDFADLAYQYSQLHPSTFKSIRWFGDQLSRVLKNNYPSEPALAELAEFEWLHTCVFDAPDASVTSIEEMLAIPHDQWSHISFVTHPSVRRINLNWNAALFWQAVNDQADLPQFEKYESSVPWLLWRKDGMTFFSELQREEARCLDDMITGLTFADMLERLVAYVPEAEAPQQLAAWLKGWLSVGIISQLKGKFDEK